jgi:hypothetical protein
MLASHKLNHMFCNPCESLRVIAPRLSAPGVPVFVLGIHKVSSWEKRGFAGSYLHTEIAELMYSAVLARECLVSLRFGGRDSDVA